MKRTKKQFFFSFLTSLALIGGLVFPLMNEPPGFSLRKIRSSFPFNNHWSIDRLSKIEKSQLSKIIAQDFNYLGCGAEMYAFLSKDGKYVLKFFKMKHLDPKMWLKWIPIPWMENYKFNKIDKRIARRNELFSSYKMAYEDLREEAGLVYIHLNKSKDLNMKVRLFDRLRKSYLIELDQYEFVIQRKGQLIQDRISFLMQQGKREEALEAVNNLLSTVVIQCKKGYIDLDSGISHNYGFLDDKVIHFDVGRIKKDERAQDPAYYQREVLRVGKKIELWLHLEWPSLIPDLEEAISAMIDEDLSLEH